MNWRVIYAVVAFIAEIRESRQLLLRVPLATLGASTDEYDGGSRLIAAAAGMVVAAWVVSSRTDSDGSVGIVRLAFAFAILDESLTHFAGDRQSDVTNCRTFLMNCTSETLHRFSVRSDSSKTKQKEEKSIRLIGINLITGESDRNNRLNV